MTLITKIQYKNYEPGEFSDQKERTYEETIAIIEHFPWEEQRDHISISLTNPSITIEDGNGNYLKLALYYAGKFVLHYLNTDLQLYTKSFIHYTDAFPYIQSFFSYSLYESNDFKLESNWLDGKAIHFKNKEFQYSINQMKFWLQVILLTGIILFYIIVTTGLLLFAPTNKAAGFVSVFILLAIFLFGRMLVILFNNYLAAKGKILIISKGNDNFYYGNQSKPEQFNKKDISEVIIFGSSNSRTRSIGYIRIEMRPKTGQHIDIPNLLIQQMELVNKLSGYPQRQVNKWFPLIPRDASTPS